MEAGKKIYDIALPHVGERYVLGSLVPKDDASYSGPWDCAELCSWAVYQVANRLYGCANNAGDPDSADAYSGFWARDANKLGVIISVPDAAKISGAVVIRVAGHDVLGHAVISKGDGTTVEAHSTKSGVIIGNLNYRRWDYGVLIPGLDYQVYQFEQAPLRKPGKIYRWTKPMMVDEKIKEIQKALNITQDGYYGPKTFNAVRAFQRNSSLVADGEVGSQTAAKLGILL